MWYASLFVNRRERPAAGADKSAEAVRGTETDTLKRRLRGSAKSTVIINARNYTNIGHYGKLLAEAEQKCNDLIYYNRLIEGCQCISRLFVSYPTVWP